MIALLLALVQQPTGATVGDTVWVNRVDRIPARQIAQAPAWEPSGDVELLGPPTLALRGDSVTLRFPLVVWRPGVHHLELPGPVFIAPDGSQRQAPSVDRTLRVATVLPEVPADSELAIQPEAAVVSRRVASPIPVVLFVVAAMVLLLPLHLWWRRLGPPLARPAVPETARPVPVETWAAAGEGRAVLSVATGTLRHALARRCPAAHPSLDTVTCLEVVRKECGELPVDTLAATLTALDDARFAPGADDRGSRLYAAAAALAERLIPETPS